MEELIKAQVEEATGVVDIDIRDEEVSEQDIVWSDVEDERRDEIEVSSSDAVCDDVAMEVDASDITTKAQETSKRGGNEVLEDANGLGQDDLNDTEGIEEDKVVEDEDEDEEVVDKLYEQADCRIIINVSSSVLIQSLEFAPRCSVLE
jgi:hypothetical protein